MVETNQNVRRWVIFTDVYKKPLAAVCVCVLLSCTCARSFRCMRWRKYCRCLCVCVSESRMPDGGLCARVFTDNCIIFWRSIQRRAAMWIKWSAALSSTVRVESARDRERERESQSLLVVYLCRPPQHTYIVCIRSVAYRSLLYTEQNVHNNSYGIGCRWIMHRAI